MQDNKTKRSECKDCTTVANAIMTHDSPVQRRDATGSGLTDWKPAGWHQVHNPSGEYDHAVDRHLIGHALIGNLSMMPHSVPKYRCANRLVQSANDPHSTGQNYYETLVRKHWIRTSGSAMVTLIYNQPEDLIPLGSHIEAKSSDGTLDQCFCSQCSKWG